MRGKEFMKRACAITTAVAFASCFSIGEVYVEAYTDNAGMVVSEVTGKGVLAGWNVFGISGSKRTEGGKKKNYIVKLNTKKSLQTVKDTYSESGGINENSEDKEEI